MTQERLPLEHTPPPTGVRFLVLGLISFAAASAYLTRYCISAANTTIQLEMGISDDEKFGYVFSAFSLGYLLFQVPGGWMGQRFGTRGAFAWSSAVWSALTVWSAFATNFTSLLASRFLFGLAQAGLAPLAGQVLKDWVPVNRRGMSSALVSGSMSIGAAAATILTGWMLEKAGLGWRTIFVLWSLVGIVWAVVFFAVFRTLPERQPWVNSAELALIRGTTDEEPFDDDERTSAPLELSEMEAAPAGLTGWQIAWRMATSVALWALCVQSFFRAAGYEFYANWLFAYLEYAWKIPKDEAGWLSSLPLGANVAGALAGGVFVDVVRTRTGNAWLSRCGTAAGSLALCGLLTWASASAGSATQLAVILGAGAFFAGMASPAIWAATIDVGGSQTGVTLGIMNMAGCLAGVVLPPVVGRMINEIRDTQGDWNGVIFLHVAIYAAAAVSCLFITSRRPVA